MLHKCFKSVAKNICKLKLLVFECGNIQYIVMGAQSRVHHILYCRLALCIMSPLLCPKVSYESFAAIKERGIIWKLIA